MTMPCLISDIQRFSTGDGPGIRTSVFIKGCNLGCRWCHNPETLSPDAQLLYYKNLCQNCGVCAKACPSGAHFMEGGAHAYERGKCGACGKCEAYCAARALRLCGKPLGTADIMRVILRDVKYYAVSGGGVTLTGGEPLLQPGLCVDILRECKANGLHTIVDTSACVPYQSIESAAPYTDEFYVDVKGNCASDYEAFTGESCGFDAVMSNLMSMAGVGMNVTARIPIIPSYNDGTGYNARLAGMLRGAGVSQASLLPFHRMGAAKYAALGMRYEYADTPPVDGETIRALAAIYTDAGIRVIHA